MSALECIGEARLRAPDRIPESDQEFFADQMKRLLDKTWSARAENCGDEVTREIVKFPNARVSREWLPEPVVITMPVIS
jgi:hypothetical protein